MNSLICAGLKTAGSGSRGAGVPVPKLLIDARAGIMHYIPLFNPRGVKGGALAVCDEIEVPVPGVGKAEGVNEGESTLKVPREVVFLALFSCVSV